MGRSFICSKGGATIVAFEQQKEAFAEQIARLIRLMPNYPGGIMFGMGDAQEATAAVLYEQKTVDFVE